MNPFNRFLFLIPLAFLNLAGPAAARAGIPHVDSLVVTPRVLTPTVSSSEPTRVRDQVFVRVRISGYDSTGQSQQQVRILATLSIQNPIRDSLLLARIQAIAPDTVVFLAEVRLGVAEEENGFHPVRVETEDGLGHVEVVRDSVNLVTRGPALRIRSLPDRDKTNSSSSGYLAVFPDSVGGSIQDLNGVRSLFVQIGSLDSVQVPLVAAADTAGLYYWKTAFPSAGSPAHRQGEFLMVVSATNTFGLQAIKLRAYTVDTIAPAPVILIRPIPSVARRSLVFVQGRAPDADSAIVEFFPATGDSTRKVKALSASNASPGSAFLDTVSLAPGRNEIVVQARDRAGNRSAVSRYVITYQSGIGLTIPQAFRAGDAILANLATAARSVDVYLLRPDGTRVRHLTTSQGVDPTGRNFELAWDLTTEGGSLVGRGPYVCVVLVTYEDGTLETTRSALVVLP